MKSFEKFLEQNHPEFYINEIGLLQNVGRGVGRALGSIGSGIGKAADAGIAAVGHGVGQAAGRLGRSLFGNQQWQDTVQPLANQLSQAVLSGDLNKLDQIYQQVRKGVEQANQAMQQQQQTQQQPAQAQQTQQQPAQQRRATPPPLPAGR